MTRPLPFACSLILALAALGCTSQSPAPQPIASESDKEAPAEVEAEAEAGVPKIACAEPIFDFGGIKPTERAEHVFKIRNEGTADLKIERVQKT